MMGWKSCGIWVSLAVAMALPIDLRAQTTTAQVRGRAVDELGSALAGVAITARHVETNTSVGVISGDTGQYVLPNLPPGRYDVSAALQGFGVEHRTDLVLQLGQDVTIDFTLNVAGLEAIVTVGANASLLEATRSTIEMIVTTGDIDDLPTIERDFSSLARLAPGVAPGAGGNGD